MNIICRKLLEHLKSCGITDVYPAFDAVPVAKKSDVLFTVLSLQSVQSGEAYPAQDGAVYPFTAQFRVDVHAPMTAQAQELLQYFFTQIVPAMLRMDSMIVRFDAGMPDIDLKLQKMVFGGDFCLNGELYVHETEGTA